MSEDYSIEINIDADGLTANLRIATSSEDAFKLSMTDLTKALKDKGVTYGINDEALQKIIEEKIFNEWVVVATGDKPVDGKDGYVNFHFSTEGPIVKIKEDSSGRINIRDLNLIQNINAGDILCELIPPEAGVSGVTVQGKDIPAKDGKEVNLPSGKNVTTSDDGKKLLADIDGMIVWDGSKVIIEPVFMADKVDANTGNIRFNGSVIINGEVGDGFEIHAGGDVSVAMTLGMVIIEAGGDVNIEGGIFGHSKGKISGNNIKMKFIQDAKVEAKGHVIVEDYILNSEVIACEPVVVKGSSGWITGSTVASETSIYTHTAGTENALRDTNLIIGYDPNSLLELEKLFEDIENRIKDFLKLKSSLVKLRAIKTKNGLNPEQEKLYTKVLSAIESIRQQITKLDTSANDITKRFDQTFEGRIYIEGVIHEGTVIRMGSGKKDILQEKTCIQFSLSEEQIIEEELSLSSDVKTLLETD